MLHTFVEYLALLIVEGIVKSEKVLPDADVSETCALSLRTPLSHKTFDRAVWLYNHTPITWHTWMLSKLACKGFLDTFRNSCIETYDTNLQQDAWHAQWFADYQ